MTSRHALPSGTGIMPGGGSVIGGFLKLPSTSQIACYTFPTTPLGPCEGRKKGSHGSPCIFLPSLQHEAGDL